jgi:hypothetical protein
MLLTIFQETEGKENFLNFHKNYLQNFFAKLLNFRENAKTTFFSFSS